MNDLYFQNLIRQQMIWWLWNSDNSKSDSIYSQNTKLCEFWIHISHVPYRNTYHSFQLFVAFQILPIYKIKSGISRQSYEESFRKVKWLYFTKIWWEIAVKRDVTWKASWAEIMTWEDWMHDEAFDHFVHQWKGLLISATKLLKMVFSFCFSFCGLMTAFGFDTCLLLFACRNWWP